MTLVRARAGDRRARVPAPAREAAGGSVHLRRRRADHVLQRARGRALGASAQAERRYGPILRLVQARLPRRNADPPRSVLDGAGAPGGSRIQRARDRGRAAGRPARDGVGPRQPDPRCHGLALGRGERPHRHQRPQASRRRPARGRPREGRVPGDPGPRAAEPVGPPAPHRRAPAHPGPSRPAVGGRRDRPADAAHGSAHRRPAGGLEGEPPEARAPQAARRAGGDRASRRRDQPPADRGRRPRARGDFADVSDPARRRPDARGSGTLESAQQCRQVHGPWRPACG